jgi:hypothetical protein
MLKVDTVLVRISESNIFLETTECNFAGKTEDNFKTRQAMYV